MAAGPGTVHDARVYHRGILMSALLERPKASRAVLTQDLQRVHAWWRAANYLSVGQIYLLDNPLLEEPLAPEHIKPRLFGHWGTTPGLNFIYAHLNRVIKARDLSVLAVIVPLPPAGGPVVAPCNSAPEDSRSPGARSGGPVARRSAGRA
jgi:phosphoketolase